MADDQFGKKIILLNKEKVCPFANASTNEFLRKIVLMNVISFWKCQEIIYYATKIILHVNCYNFTTKVYKISILIKYMIEDSFF